MQPRPIEEVISDYRAGIQQSKEQVARLSTHLFFSGDSTPLPGGNVPIDMHENMRANITLAFRHLEDARMRLGKVLQAKDGGISIYDRGASEESQ